MSSIKNLCSNKRAWVDTETTEIDPMSNSKTKTKMFLFLPLASCNGMDCTGAIFYHYHCLKITAHTTDWGKYGDASPHIGLN